MPHVLVFYPLQSGQFTQATSISPRTTAPSPLILHPIARQWSQWTKRALIQQKSKKCCTCLGPELSRKLMSCDVGLILCEGNAVNHNEHLNYSAVQRKTGHLQCIVNCTYLFFLWTAVLLLSPTARYFGRTLISCITSDNVSKQTGHTFSDGC